MFNTCFKYFDHNFYQYFHGICNRNYYFHRNYDFSNRFTFTRKSKLDYSCRSYIDNNHCDNRILSFETKEKGGQIRRTERKMESEPIPLQINELLIFRNNIGSMPFSFKYKPKTLKDYVGQKDAVELFMNWIKKW